MNRRLSFVLLVAVASVSLGVMGTSAQSIDMATHPIVGTWLLFRPNPAYGPGTSITTDNADGTYISTGPLASVGQDGKVGFTSPLIGTWEPTGPRTVHATGTALFSDADGKSTGSITYDGSNTITADGMTQFEEPGAVITVRDALGNITATLPGVGPTLSSVRMVVGAPGFPDMSAAPGASPSTAP